MCMTLTDCELIRGKWLVYDAQHLAPPEQMDSSDSGRQVSDILFDPCTRDGMNHAYVP